MSIKVWSGTQTDETNRGIVSGHILLIQNEDLPL